MKEQDNKLTLKETEQLCRLYMDCNLSVLEETELRYFLNQVDYHSTLIDEVRRIMDLDTHIPEMPASKVDDSKKSMFRKWLVRLSVAASISIIFITGILFFRSISTDSEESKTYYIAYVDGQRLSDEEAKTQIEAEKKSVDEFIKEMSEIEAREQQKIDNFFNL